jgi:hypothetical protein
MIIEDYRANLIRQRNKLREEQRGHWVSYLRTGHPEILIRYTQVQATADGIDIAQ